MNQICGAAQAKRMHSAAAEQYVHQPEEPNLEAVAIIISGVGQKKWSPYPLVVLCSCQPTHDIMLTCAGMGAHFIVNSWSSRTVLVNVNKLLCPRRTWDKVSELKLGCQSLDSFETYSRK